MFKWLRKRWIDNLVISVEQLSILCFARLGRFFAII